MKKLLLFIAASGFLFGCAATHTYLLYDTSIEPDKVVTLTSKFGQETKALIESELDLKTSLFGPKISEAIIIAVDEQRGESNLPRYHKVFNNGMNGQFEIKLLPGEHNLLVSPNYHLAQADDIAAINFQAQADHQYFIGNVLEITKAPIETFPGIRISKGEYRWIPLVVDKTARQLIYPQIKK